MNLTDAALDREWAQLRQQYYGLSVSLLAKEPTGALLALLRDGIAARSDAARALHPLLGEGWDAMAEALTEATEQSANDEFLRLFIGPFQPEVTPYESHYLTGQIFQQPLIAVRTFLGQVGLERDEARFPEPEDALAFEMETMNWLLTRQSSAASPEEAAEWLHRQGAFLKHHLLVWGPACAEDIRAAKSAALYKGVGKLIAGFLAWELQQFQLAGLGPVETLEQARRHHSQFRRYSGPLIEDQFNAKAKPE
jgi:TorA maturation chaperone TorD